MRATPGSSTRRPTTATRPASRRPTRERRQTSPAGSNRLLDRRGGRSETVHPFSFEAPASALRASSGTGPPVLDVAILGGLALVAHLAVLDLAGPVRVVRRDRIGQHIETCGATLGRKAVEAVGDFRLRLTFEDGTVEDVDFGAREWRGVLEPLSDPASDSLTRVTGCSTSAPRCRLPVAVPQPSSCRITSRRTLRERLRCGPPPLRWTLMSFGRGPAIGHADAAELERASGPHQECHSSQVEGLVTCTGRWSSNLPGRTRKSPRTRAFLVARGLISERRRPARDRARRRLGRGYVETPALGRGGFDFNSSTLACASSLRFSTRALCSSLRASRLAFRCASWAAAISSSTWTTGRRMTSPPSRAIALSITSGLCSVTWARTAVRVG